jgi:hypothetical protein
MVKKAAQNPKQLAEALAVARFKDFAVSSQQRFEELDSLQRQQQTAATLQRRQMQLTKMHDSQRHMQEWQSEGGKKHRENLNRHKETEQGALRFELSVRERKLRARGEANATATAELSSGVEDFERMLSRLANDGAAEEPAEQSMAGVDAPPAEHLARLERKLPNPKCMEAEARAYMDKLRSRRLEEQASRKEREMRRRKVMLEQAQAQEQLEARRREGMLLDKLSRQCAEEKRIAQQLWQTQQEKMVMAENRALRERQYEERRELDEQERVSRTRELSVRAREEYAQQLVLERTRAEEAAAARAAAKHAKHEVLCRGVAEQLVGLASRVADFRSTTQPLLPTKVMREWLTLFIAGTPLEADRLSAAAQQPEAEEEAAPDEATALLHESELDDYLTAGGEWSREALGAVPVDAGADERCDMSSCLPPCHNRTSIYTPHPSPCNHAQVRRGQACARAIGARLRHHRPDGPRAARAGDAVATAAEHAAAALVAREGGRRGQALRGQVAAGHSIASAA